jgi:hypothetical protein
MGESKLTGCRGPTVRMSPSNCQLLHWKAICAAYIHTWTHVPIPEHDCNNYKILVYRHEVNLKHISIVLIFKLTENVLFSEVRFQKFLNSCNWCFLCVACEVAPVLVATCKLSFLLCVRWVFLLSFASCSPPVSEVQYCFNLVLRTFIEFSFFTLLL